jgi:hypothetical protein
MDKSRLHDVIRKTIVDTQAPFRWDSPELHSWLDNLTVAIVESLIPVLTELEEAAEYRGRRHNLYDEPR